MWTGKHVYLGPADAALGPPDVELFVLGGGQLQALPHTEMVMTTPDRKPTMADKTVTWLGVTGSG